MKEIQIPLDYSAIEEVIEPKNKGLIIKFKNGDRLSFKPSSYAKKLRRHLKKTENGEHLG